MPATAPAGFPKPIIEGNLPLGVKYKVKNRDGSISTVRTISIGVDGGEVVIPTVLKGRIVSDEEAIRHFEETGANFGTFRSPEEAKAFSEWLHDQHAAELQQGTGFDRLVAITIQSESAGNPNAVSKKGAKGLMQVMPGTSRDPGFGIRPSDGTQQDDVRVGREYLAAMHQRYNGDLSRMWAAYNWGPGNLDRAIARYGNDWLRYAPQETRDYVTKNLRALGMK